MIHIKPFLTVVILTMTTLITQSQQVSTDMARITGKNFFYERISQFKDVDYGSVQEEWHYQYKYNDTLVCYLFQLNKGFVIVSAYQAMRPVLAYSFDGKLDIDDMPPGFSDRMGFYARQMLFRLRNGVTNDPSILQEWERLQVKDPALLKDLRGQKSVEPLLTSKWDQDFPYNFLCPIDPAGPGGRALAGCVATAMGQVMNYYRWPDQGTGSYTYTHQTYGTLSADFGSTHYFWDGMENEMTKPDTAIALLLNHLGISVDMNYGPSGSGMYNHKAAYSLRTYFRYAPETQYIFRDSTNMDWDSIHIAHLDRKMPMYCAGWTAPGSTSGHAYVCDGYQDSSYFHFNWGWGGTADGYFYFSNMTPGGSNFNFMQEVIINCYPDTINNTYPGYCSGSKVISDYEGTIEDGSGPMDHYTNNSSCQWLIQPQNKPYDSISYIILSFDKFDLSDPGDVLTIYDGADNTASILGSYSGNTLPSALSSSGNTLFIEFTSDNQGTGEGFLLSYQSKFPEYCDNMAISDPSGVISDGSGDKYYQNNTTCTWMITPQGAESLTLEFDYFSTEPNNDFLEIYDLNSQELLATYSGNSPGSTPPPVTSPSGSMYLLFKTDRYNRDLGWQAHYHASGAGIDDASENNAYKIFPNPANSSFQIICSKDCPKNLTVSLLSVTGIEMLKKDIRQFNTDILTFDISSFSPGIYFVKLTAENRHEIHKLLIHQ